MQRIPDRLSSLVLGHLAQHIFSHGSDESAENKLILDIPAKVVRVGDLTSSITGALSDVLGWCRNRAINIAKELVGTKDRRSLGFPQKEIVTQEVDSDGAANGRNSDSGR
jgi:hypothetical protein